MVSISFIWQLRLAASPVILSFLLILPASLHAFHGLFLPAYGARQAGFGGASLALGGSVMDLQNNPSGMALLDEGLFEAGVAINRATIRYNDRTYFPGENIYFENHNTFHPVSPLPYMGYATPVGDRYAFGVAIYAQGGGGAEIDGIYRRAATETTSSGGVSPSACVTEDLKFRFLHAKLTVGGAASSGRLRVGLAIDLSYGTNRLDRTLTVLPGVAAGTGTGIEENDPLSYVRAPGGFHYRSRPAFAPSGKIGFSYDLNRSWSVAYAYTADSQLELDGMMRVDSTDALRQGSSRVERTLAWPDRHSTGIAYRGGDVTVAFDLHYISWSRHFDRMTFQMDRPMVGTPLGPVSPALIWNLRWKDQTVAAIGLEYRVDHLAFRIGTSYGATPIPAEGLSPFLGSTTEYHFSFGLGYTKSRGSFDVALEYAPGRTINGSPLADWAISRQVQGAAFQFERSTSTKGLYMGMRYKI
jgi:long-chain fatty acid transport protein